MKVVASLLTFSMFIVYGESANIVVGSKNVCFIEKFEHSNNDAIKAEVLKNSGLCTLGKSIPVLIPT